MQTMWPISQGGGHLFPQHVTSVNHYISKPRVGLGVICLCRPHKYGVECLLLRRGPKFVSPLKWSFPGGRLDEDEDLDDDGERGTMAELKKECGGGTPLGLPPLIHIECYKSGRTLYHVYVLDIESHTSWLQWQPSRTLEHNSEIDLSAIELSLQGRLFPANNGFCWVDMQTLIEECMAININDTEAVSSNQLQHGLIRWVRTNGENILKTLLARSPNLAYQRRQMSSSSSSLTTPNSRSSNRPQSFPSGIKGRQWLHPNSYDVPRPPLISYSNYPHPPGAALYSDYQLHDNQLFNHFVQQQRPQSNVQQPADQSSNTRTLPDSGERTLVPNQVLTHFVPTTDSPPNLYDTVTYQGGAATVEPGILPPPPLVSSPLDGNQGGAPRKPHPRRYELCKNYMVTGVCPFGEKCWFVHPDDKIRDPLLVPVSPLPQPNSWAPPSGYVVDQYGSQPQSPLGSTFAPPPWRFPGNRQGVVPMVRPGFPVQGSVVFQPYLFPAGRYVLPGSQGAVPGVADPVLKFKLLSEISLPNFQPGTAVSLAVRADHLYLGMEDTVYDYRILFGGYGESYSFSAQQKFHSKVSHVHSSKMQSLVIIVGLIDGSVYCWDPRKGSSTPIVAVYESIEGDSSPVTALIHFTTTIEGAQVVVAGNANGHITWYIAQPPMKTYTVLSSSKEHSPHKVTSLQVFGGCLISGCSKGKVCLWSMRSHEPTLVDCFSAHSNNLLDIFALDTSSFLTIGLTELNTTDTTLQQTDTTNTSPNDTVDAVSSNLANVSISSPALTYHASVWDYNKSFNSIKQVNNLGEVLVTAFHQQPYNLGNQFLALGLQGGTVKIYNVPSFSVASEIHFSDFVNCDCLRIALNLSREKENTHHFNLRNPFRDLILTTVWSDGRVMVCQIEGNRNNNK